jgi:two-component system chemotaxis response regulator CheY
MKILIVDDSKTMRMIVARTLKQAGFGDHTIVQAADGKEGLTVVQESSPDVILSDWNMPEMNGLEFLKELRASGNTVHFGFVTSESTAEMRDQATEAGAGFFVTKPFTPESLERAISPALVWQRSVTGSLFNVSHTAAIDLILCAAAWESHVMTNATDASKALSIDVADIDRDCDKPGSENASVATGCRVLLAEDTRCMQLLIGRLCEKAGASVVYVDDGVAAYETAIQAQVAAEPFDIVLMDMQMPVCDGYSATQRLRSDGYESPIIALTANAQEGDREKCIAAGCDDYVTKPIDRNVLNSLLQQYAPVASGW